MLRQVWVVFLLFKTKSYWLIQGVITVLQIYKLKIKVFRYDQTQKNWLVLTKFKRYWFIIQNTNLIDFWKYLKYFYLLPRALTSQIRLFENPNQQTKDLKIGNQNKERWLILGPILYGPVEVLWSTLLPKRTSEFESTRFRTFLLWAAFGNPQTSFLCFRLTTRLLFTEPNLLYWHFPFFKHSVRFHFLDCKIMLFFCLHKSMSWSPWLTLQLFSHFLDTGNFLLCTHRWQISPLDGDF